MTERLSRKAKFLLLRAMSFRFTVKIAPCIHRAAWFRNIIRGFEEFRIVPPIYTQHFPLVSRFDVSVPGARRFTYLYEPPDLVGWLIYRHGFIPWEISSLPVFLDAAGKARVVIDVGANSGAYTLLALAANRHSRVISVEPNPEMFRRLEWNARRNGEGRCSAHQVAISDHADEGCLHVPADDSMASLHREGFRGLPGKRVSVRLVTLDSLVPEDVSVDLMKIDVEGFEPEVLRGSERILRCCRPTILLECHPDGPADRLNEILVPLGYQFFHITDGGLVSVPAIAPAPHDSRHNYLCLPASIAPEEALRSGCEHGT